MVFRILLFFFLYPLFIGLGFTTAKSTCFLPPTNEHHDAPGKTSPTSFSHLWFARSRASLALSSAQNFPVDITASLKSAITNGQWLVFIGEEKQNSQASDETVREKEESVYLYDRYKFSSPTFVFIARIARPSSPNDLIFTDFTTVKLSLSGKVDPACEQKELRRALAENDRNYRVNKYRARIVSKSGTELKEKMESGRTLDSFRLTFVGTWEGPRYRLDSLLGEFTHDYSQKCFDVRHRNSFTIARHLSSRLVPACGQVSKADTTWHSSKQDGGKELLGGAEENVCRPKEEVSRIFARYLSEFDGPSVEGESSSRPAQASCQLPATTLPLEDQEPTGIDSAEDLQKALGKNLFDIIPAVSPETPVPIKCTRMLKRYRSLATRFSVDLPPISDRLYCGRTLVPIYSADSQTTPIGHTSVSYTFLPSESCVRGQTCQGALIRSYGGPAPSHVSMFWREAETTSLLAPNYDWISYDQRAVGYSSFDNDFCGATASESAEFITRILGLLRTLQVPLRGASSRVKRKSVMSQFLSYASEYGKLCYGYMTKTRLQNMGTVTAADDAALVVDSVAGFVTEAFVSNAPITVWVASYDARTAQVLALRHKTRVIKGIISSAEEVNLGVDYTEAYVHSLKDIEIGIDYFCAFCYAEPACKIHSLRQEAAVEIRSKATIKKILEQVLSDDYAQSECSLQVLWKELFEALTDPGALFAEFADNIRQCFMLQSFVRTHSWHPDFGQTSELWANHVLLPVSAQGSYGGFGDIVQDYNRISIRCADADDFGNGFDDEEIVETFSKAQKVSKIGSYSFFDRWILCRYFSDDMKSALKVPVEELQDPNNTLDAAFLFISNEYDPLTPSVNTKAASARFRNSKYIFQKGTLGHGLEGKSRNDCMDKIIRQYLKDGTFPNIDFCPPEKSSSTYSLPFEAAKIPELPFEPIDTVGVVLHYVSSNEARRNDVAIQQVARRNDAAIQHVASPDIAVPDETRLNIALNTITIAKASSNNAIIMKDTLKDARLTDSTVDEGATNSGATSQDVNNHGTMNCITILGGRSQPLSRRTNHATGREAKLNRAKIQDSIISEKILKGSASNKDRYNGRTTRITGCTIFERNVNGVSYSEDASNCLPSRYRPDSEDLDSHPASERPSFDKVAIRNVICEDDALTYLTISGSETKGI
ncbi:hypothetical protein BJ508DRAFT_313488 [Ascobolus immersus RN42]|uniref:Peptidase S33 tripeptidyl aminopeptidase-like C-terminal domain-containing protein n=1 Tax=Ascobolus immersus RN42 TaxID=1160509 RepID=A0A3N4HP12_ASCIM|nr:hypothetical protein BJ508DRAFT_313488 [Ascobolus immersus RN42]